MNEEETNELDWWGEEYPNDEDDEFEVDEEWAEIDEISEWEYVDDDWR